MSRERTDGDMVSEDHPDWFDADLVDDATDARTPTGNGPVDGGTGDWFDDPDHRPLDFGTAVTGVTDDQSRDEEGMTVSGGDRTTAEKSTGTGTSSTTENTADEMAEDTPVASEPGPVSVSNEQKRDAAESVSESDDTDGNEVSSLLDSLIAWIRSVLDRQP